jgi:membrane protease YdiL (CAAX protease family)
LSSLSQSQVNFPDFFLAVVGFSIVMTLVFVNTKGSILWAGIVPHFLINATGRAGIPEDGWIFGLAALVLLLFAGKDLRFGAKPDYAPEDDVAPYVNTAAQVRS